jgi:putative RNA 2'-phosphotransferase
MENSREKKISKALSYWLRHNPEDIGIKLNSSGWTDVRELIEKASSNLLFDFNELKYVVQNNEKQRFSLSGDFCSIRANTGHSVKVDLDMKEVKPPTHLYHGTSESSLKSIMKEGLMPQKRHHVHLSSDIETAKVVANRRGGKKVVLRVEALKMRANGYKVYFLNNIYFADKVNPEFISILEEYS